MFIIKDNDILDESGKTVSFGITNFKNIICQGNTCFICGASRSEKTFRDQQVLPLWLIRKFDLYAKKITLINNIQTSYNKYKIPCCSDCNLFIEEYMETPVRELLESGYEKIKEYVISNGPWLFITWLSLLFFKSNYKDIVIKYHLHKKNNLIITEAEWERLHHIYNIARSLYASANIDKTVLSSFYLLQVKENSHPDNFDFNQIYNSKSILLRYENIAFISILDDGCGVHSLYNEIKQINGKLSIVQLREVFAKISYLSSILKYRPKFGSGIDSMNNKYIIDCKNTNYVETNKFEQAKFGSLFYSLCCDFLKAVPLNDKIKIEENIKQGNWTFLFNEKGEFINN